MTTTTPSDPEGLPYTEKTDVDARLSQGVQIGDHNTQINHYDTHRKVPSESWPRRVGILPGLADCFQTRTLVADLADATDDGGTAVLAGSDPASPVASTRLLSGMGGVGKTQLAVDLAHRLYDTGQLDLLVWITATSREAITAGYAQAAVDLALTGADGSDTGRDAARFHAWLATTEQRWLVVLDDVGTAADLKELWPPARPVGRTVVTTRLRGHALAGPGRHLIPVGVFAPAEAVAYLQDRLTDHSRLADDIEGLAAALYHLPLALAHATAYMIDEDVPCSEYQRRLAESGRRLDDLAPSTDELPDDYTKTIAETVALSVRAANRARPVGLASPLLDLASVLHPAGVPSSVFTTTAARNWLTYARGAPDDIDAADLTVETITSGLRRLHRLNLITFADETVGIHGLVQRVTRDELTKDRLVDLAWAAADALVEVWPFVEHDSNLGQRLRDNSAAVYRHGGDALLSPDTHAVLHRAARSLRCSRRARCL
ncbi:NB-ARC domain-containing protein [Dactylosporangium sp. NBC_01737]|uniref:NB-ARC domain-containing protein n=1 Tax=Dactylosporangium sp. NBC_01737 TaxID=2975959 RepID=UPI002E0FCD94|nr:NB-ARC domain-containing protein [Dactylosporangium sp. NBC_01737]